MSGEHAPAGGVRVTLSRDTMRTVEKEHEKDGPPRSSILTHPVDVLSYRGGPGGGVGRMGQRSSSNSIHEAGDTARLFLAEIKPGKSGASLPCLLTCLLCFAF
eukprot:GHVU01082201.1.p2 GENE.GHVU01082201.1~~GHVU01082201.1.p2  ORF type:complete len:103 (+),score=3.62 GHVU01082201.1:660-968(+)